MNQALLSIITALVSGVLFGGGLVLSGMTDTNNIQNFLDLFGNWDPKLMLVMASGLAVTAIGYRFILKSDKPKLHSKFELPTSKSIDPKLLAGSGLFGIGWALVGLCPGPALASAVYGYWQTIVVILSMIVGHLVTKYLVQKSQ